MNKFAYILSIYLAPALALALIFGVEPSNSDSSLALGIFAATLVGVSVIAFLRMVYRMWSAIRDGSTTITPGRAVGFLFIPFYNLYWLFRVIPGFAGEYNAYVTRRGLTARPMSAGLLT